MNKRQATILLAALAICMACPGRLSRADGPRHKFLAHDESRHQLVYVDETDSSNDWTLKLPDEHRDLQLVGGDVVLINSPDGYREYDLATQKLLKEVDGYPGAVSVRRMPDGRTILTCNEQTVVVHELDADDKVLRKIKFDVPTTRVVRFTPQGTLLFGSANQVFEGDFSGAILHRHTLPEKVWAYQALRLPSGNLLVAGGYDTRMFELDAEGQVVKTIGGGQTAEDKALGLHLLAGFQILRNGNIVVSNWSGHGVDDSEKGVQIVEYDPRGRLVWKWSDPVRAGTIDGLIVLDDLDTGVLNDDVSSVLGPVTADSYSR